MVYKGIGGVAQNRYGLVAHDLAVEAVVDAGCSGDDGLIFGMACGSLEHQGQIVADFTHTGARHQSNDGTVGEAMSGDKAVKIGEILACLSHLLHGGVADINCLVTPLLVPVGFKGQNAVHVIDVAADVLDAPFFPYPYLG